MFQSGIWNRIPRFFDIDFFVVHDVRFENILSTRTYYSFQSVLTQLHSRKLMGECIYHIYRIVPLCIDFKCRILFAQSLEIHRCQSEAVAFTEHGIPRTD